ncbi:hypothetical protein BASA50_006757 [Batrachochytrium salamandrivorans]|uniref:Anaphase-promoting complex subunit 4 WD40 domain-containing protein n=1 Tax=Batrachochytrium salamandrivorans TaxID=1357716 RepID=A0ABQ8F914_9FUNG|nr:hypothetical protein BASA61_005272 [Batrachochytrium salamandrivorans]KAH6594286.1 hypothetical protein BASA50_006757 [Batrachochytrium salamandrivorans]KAH9250287.1 hypothetical protein BASA81_011904 [Batrachochytrium salamandrivorans]KAH9270033.1 hypothetical protein BASA83_007862 [Batrachochytrium salamandrivorans]
MNTKAASASSAGLKQAAAEEEDASLMLSMAQAMGLPSGFGKKPRKPQQQQQPTSLLRQEQLQRLQRQQRPSKLSEADQEEPDLSNDRMDPTPTSAQTSERIQGILHSDSDSDDSGSDDDNEANDTDTIPSAMAALQDHSKAVTALSLDPAAARLVTAGRDYSVKLWDFHGMTASMKPFRTIEPSLGNPIRDVQFSTTGDQFLVVAATSQLKIYDRDGGFISEFPKGDPYIRDLRHTKGHISALTCARWHPTSKNICISASMDSTIRIWDLEQTPARKQKDVIYVKSRLPGGRTNITAMCTSHDGRMIACAGSDGGLRLWNSNGPFLTPSKSIEKAHLPGGAASSISFAVNGHHMVTRAMDDTLKLWDIRSFKAPVAVAADLDCYFEETNAIFSPNDRYILTGTSSPKGSQNGSIAIFDRQTLDRVQDISLPGSIVRLHWSAKLRQIFAGSGDGSVHVLYDPTMHMTGITAALAKKPKKLRVEDYDVMISREAIVGPISVPGSYMRGEKPMSKRKTLEREAALRRPEIPSAFMSKGAGGKIGTNSTQEVMKDMLKDTRRQEDPREAILKFAEAAASDPYWISPAYKSSQPNAVLTENVYEDDFEESLEQRKKRRQ